MTRGAAHEKVPRPNETWLSHRKLQTPVLGIARILDRHSGCMLQSKHIAGLMSLHITCWFAALHPHTIDMHATVPGRAARARLILAVALLQLSARAKTVPRSNLTTSTRACQPPYDSFPFCNTSLSFDTRVRDLISRLEDSDIPAQLTARHSGGGNPGPESNVSRLGIPTYDWGECSKDGPRSPTASALLSRLRVLATSSQFSHFLLARVSHAGLNGIHGVQSSCVEVGH